MNAVTAAGLGVAIVLIILFLRWKWRSFAAKEIEEDAHTYVPCAPMQVVHRLCPHHNVVQRYEVEEKDSLDEHLDVLTRKLAEKEGRLRLSKSKIRETQNEIENLHAIDHDVRVRYREIMESLRKDLLSNEKECKRLQEQIEWVSRRRAELKDEVRRGQRLYGEAAAELASNLAELQRGRVPDYRIIDKPQRQPSLTSLRLRKEPHLPRATPVGSVVIKSTPPMSPTNVSRGEIME
ncbi:uncharacterized protein LOC110373581 isoform X1 [Helicoverpa armigera]|uniref:uncharacterized protein LOC110373581 isoform X1 n=1 Tax=Helicoverpa armigera TaxID=29058 RepID=UPI000B371787|nr:uncharacterized protein LOC110373581 isoform X1 [Helicoverpa armigera]PZC80685.1 hypothetical protein B5X24_HaOG214086 [Helicoverpa armigera]